MKKELNWNDKILGLSLIKVRDFLRYRKFKSINNQDVINFFKGEVKEKPFIDKLVELDLIKKITKKHLNSIELEDGDSSDIGSYRLTEFGIRLTTKKKVKQRDKKYCDKLIEEIKLKAYELNRIDACPVYISEIKVFGSYLTKKEDELLNDLDISVKIETKEKDIDLYEKCCDFCKAFNITPKSHNYWMFSEIDATYSFLQNGIGNKNSFLHILSHSDIKDEWKTKIVFSDKLDLQVSDYIHKSSRLIINAAKEQNVTKIIVGNNKNWKNEINIGTKNNNSFCSIPHDTLIEKIKYKAQLEGIEMICTQEAYTSKCSAIDLEPIEKHETYVGKRKKRGLFVTKDGKLINADCNGSLNIARLGLSVSGNEINISESLVRCVSQPKKVNVLYNKTKLLEHFVKK